MRRDQIKLKWKIFVSFCIFAIIIVGIFWLLQVAFLNNFYKAEKKSECYDTADHVIALLQKNGDLKNLPKNNDLIEQISNIASAQEIDIWISVKGNGPQEILYGVWSVSDVDTFSLAKQNQLTSTWERLSNSATNESFEENFQKFVFSKLSTINNQQVLLVFEVRLIMVNAVASVLSAQFKLITVFVILLAIIFALVLDRIVSYPLAEISRSAKRLAKGDYGTIFEAHGFTEVRELKDTLNYAARELGKLDRYQKELIANVSHDLRTPITLIVGYSEMMRDYPKEVNSANLQVVIDEAKRLTSLVNDILSLTKLQSGNEQLNNERYSLTESIKSIINRNSKLLEQLACKITFEFDRSVEVIADEIQISKVIYNFISNATNYAGDDRQVIVRQIVNKDNTVTISVIDHGIGIAEEDLENVWNRYYKVDKTHQRATIGSGLGLSIVKAVLENYHYEYGCNSELGKGSEFWFTMPIAPVEIDKFN